MTQTNEINHNDLDFQKKQFLLMGGEIKNIQKNSNSNISSNNSNNNEENEENLKLLKHFKKITPILYTPQITSLIQGKSSNKK